MGARAGDSAGHKFSIHAVHGLRNLCTPVGALPLGTVAPCVVLAPKTWRDQATLAGSADNPAGILACGCGSDSLRGHACTDRIARGRLFGSRPARRGDIGDWYGIIFNASDATFGSNPSNFAYNETYYRLYFYNIDATSPIGINLDRCDGGADAAHNSCTTLANSSIPSNFIGNSGGFDTIHIKRLASDGTIEVQVDGQTLMTVHNSKFIGSTHGKFGAFIWSSSNNALQNPMTGYQMQVDFDNIKVYSH